jgi:hypothetical protein
MSKRTVGYVAWGGKTGQLSADINLGYGHSRNVPAHGIRRAIWDSAFGYVNGFPLSAILYYALTRSLNRRLSVWAMKREGITFSYSQTGMPIPHAIVSYSPQVALIGGLNMTDVQQVLHRGDFIGIKPERYAEIRPDRFGYTVYLYAHHGWVAVGPYDAPRAGYWRLTLGSAKRLAQRHLTKPNRWTTEEVAPHNAAGGIVPLSAGTYVGIGTDGKPETVIPLTPDNLRRFTGPDRPASF